MPNYNLPVDAGFAFSNSYPIRRKVDTVTKAEPYKQLRIAIWTYFLLLIFEGAIRKWMFPGFAPLLLIRDPLALWIIIKARMQSVFSLNTFVFYMALLTILGIYTAIFFGHGNILVALYGARITLLHFPLIFIIGSIFNRADVVKMGKVLLFISVPMVLLTIVQFHSPQSAWVNHGVSGDIDSSAGFTGALGFFRPPGTFSFTNGNALFFSLVAAFVFYFWFHTKEINRLLLFAATAALLAAIPYSISRTLFFEVCLSTAFAVFAVFRKPGYAGKILFAVAGIAVLFTILHFTGILQTAIAAFTERFTTANENEGGLKGVLGSRYLSTMFDAVTDSNQLPFFGYGLGMGTSVGGMLLMGKTGLLLAEDEWTRIIKELGLVMGAAVILVRVTLFIKMAIYGYRKLSAGDFLPWMLLSFGIVNIPQGQWAQPTALGFGILIGGLLLASLRNETVTTKQEKTYRKKEIHFFEPN